MKHKKRLFDQASDRINETTDIVTLMQTVLLTKTFFKMLFTGSQRSLLKM
jgi:hypothetical protein